MTVFLQKSPPALPQTSAGAPQQNLSEKDIPQYWINVPKGGGCACCPEGKHLVSANNIRQLIQHNNDHVKEHELKHLKASHEQATGKITYKTEDVNFGPDTMHFVTKGETEVSIPPKDPHDVFHSLKAFQNVKAGADAPQDDMSDQDHKISGQAQSGIQWAKGLIAKLSQHGIQNEKALKEASKSGQRLDFLNA